MSASYLWCSGFGLLGGSSASIRGEPSWCSFRFGVTTFMFYGPVSGKKWGYGDPYIRLLLDSSGVVKRGVCSLPVLVGNFATGTFTLFFLSRVNGCKYRALSGILDGSNSGIGGS